MADEQMALDKFLPENVPAGKIKRVMLQDLPEDMPGPEPTAEFVDSVRRFGVVFPIVLIEKGPLLFEIVDGRRRVKAARKAELRDVQARVYEDDGLLSMDAVLTISLNRLRSDNPAAELEAIEALWKKGASMQQIRKATGLPQATIEKRLQLQNLKGPFRAALADGKIAVSVAEALAKLPGPAQVRLMRKFKKDGRVTMSDVKVEKSARAVNEMEQLPASVFGSAATPWRDTVIARLKETLKLIPEQEDGARSRLAELIDWLSEGA